MSPKPVIFISAVSGELRSARQLVANTLTFLGYEPEWQDVFGLEEGDLRGMLRRRIDHCAGVVQLVGNRYGFEPPAPDEVFGRVSYTQYEALYARRRGKRVWYVFLDDRFPRDVCGPEGEELRALQEVYREGLRAETHVFHPISNEDGLKAGVLMLRDELGRLRRRVKQWAAAVVGLLVVMLGVGAWLLLGQREMERGMAGTHQQLDELKTQNEKLLAALRELPEALGKQAVAGGEKEDEAARMARAYALLEQRLSLPAGSLEKELPRFAEALLSRGDASALDRANALFATRQFAEAEAQALVAKEKALTAAGQPVRDAIAALELAGQAAQEQILFGRALEHYRAAAALTSRERDAAEWAGVQFRIAQVRLAMGEPEEPERICRAVREVYEGLRGPEDHEVLSVRDVLARALTAQARYEEAAAEYRAVLEIRVRLHGAENPVTLVTRMNLAITLYHQGKFEEAEPEYRAIVALRTRTLGPAHPRTLSGRNNLAIVLSAQGQHEAAEAEHRAVRELYETAEEARSASPLDVLSNRNNLARALFSQGKPAEAEVEFRAVHTGYERLLGADHPHTLSCRQNLGMTLGNLGRHAEAEMELRGALAAFERRGGPDHADALIACFHLASELEAQERREEALAFARRAREGLEAAGARNEFWRGAKALQERLEAAGQ